ncbi:protein of unknown function [Acidithiobacillus ferrivorans]|uniref:Uncharacterized protein n=1 Tax=Acidithiobacillus ferrivorans TaxID=160808 RepID=A0ABY1MKL9_9PROT|nr:protein of unknown function [Acidithiobacillus ferrivorans]
MAAARLEREPVSGFCAGVMFGQV